MIKESKVCRMCKTRIAVYYRTWQHSPDATDYLCSMCMMAWTMKYESNPVKEYGFKKIKDEE